MSETAVAHVRATTSPAALGRILFLVVAMTLWADANDFLRVKYAIGTVPMLALRTVVDCGGVLWLGCIVWGHSSLRDLGWRFPRPARLIAVGVLVTVVNLAGIFTALALHDGLPAVRELAEVAVAMTPAKHAFYGAVGAKVAFWEETLFRGDLLRALRLRMGTTQAVLASSAIFALYHLSVHDFGAEYDPVVFLSLFLHFLTGVAFACATVRTRSLLPATVAHTLQWALLGDN